MIEQGGVIDCGLFAIRLSLRNGQFMLIEVITSGINTPIKYSMFNRPKVIKVVEKVEKPKITPRIKEDTTKIKQEELI